MRVNALDSGLTLDDLAAVVQPGLGEAEIAHARRIVEAFAADASAGAIGLDGKMIDIPHLKAARKVLASL